MGFNVASVEARLRGKELSELLYVCRFGGSLSLGGMAEALLSAPKWKSKRLALTRWDKPLAPKAMRCVCVVCVLCVCVLLFL